MTTFTSYGGGTLDNWISAGVPTGQYGTFDPLRIGNSTGDSGHIYRSIIKNPLTGIPSNAIVTSGSLTFTVSSETFTATRTLRVYALLRNWAYDQSTWNVYTTGNNWQTAGATGALDAEGTDCGNVSVTATPGTTITIPLSTSKLTAWISGAQANYGVLVKFDSDDGFAEYVYVYSGDNATESNRPLWTVNYTMPGGCTFTCVL